MRLKRLLAMVLAVCLMVGAFPTLAYASSDMAAIFGDTVKVFVGGKEVVNEGTFNFVHAGEQDNLYFTVPLDFGAGLDVIEFTMPDAASPKDGGTSVSGITPAPVVNFDPSSHKMTVTRSGDTSAAAEGTLKVEFTVSVDDLDLQMLRSLGLETLTFPEEVPAGEKPVVSLWTVSSTDPAFPGEPVTTGSSSVNPPADDGALFLQILFPTHQNYTVNRFYDLGDLPAGLVPKNNQEINDGTPAVTLHFDPDGRIGATFSTTNYTDVCVNIPVTIDPSAAQKEGDDYVFTLPVNGYQVRIPAEGSAPSADPSGAPALAKELVSPADETGVATWRILYTPPAASYTGDRPQVIVDTLPEGLVFDEDYGMAYPNSGKADVTFGRSLNATVNNQAAITLPPSVSSGMTNSSGQIVLTYRTRFTQQEVLRMWQHTNNPYEYENNAEARVNSTTASAIVEDTANMTATGWGGDHPVLTKEGEYDSAARTVRWTVKVNAATVDFSTLDLLDTMGKGFIFNENSVTVNGQSLSAQQRSLLTVSNGAADDSGFSTTEMRLRLISGGTSNFTGPIYTIQYTTSVRGAYFNQELTEDDVTNQARLSYTWPGTGIAPGAFNPPTISKGPVEISLSQSILQHRAEGSYDPATRTMRWTYVINPNSMDISSARFTATLNIFGDESTKGAYNARFACDGAELKEIIYNALMQADPSLDLDSAKQILGNIVLMGDGRSFTFDLLNTNPLGLRSFQFTLPAQVEDSSFWASNGEADFYSTAKLENIRLGDGTQTASETAPASQRAASTVVRKAPLASAYDAKEKTIAWEILLNENRADLGRVEIIDTVPTGTEYVENSTTSSANISVGNPSPNRGNYLWTIQSLADAASISYKTRLTEAAFGDAMYEPVLAFENVIKVSSQHFGQQISASSTVRVQNEILTKSASTIGNKVTYRVDLNPNGVNLMPTNALSLVDVMDDGLLLDLDSVRLYEGIPSAQRVFDLSAGYDYSVAMARGQQIDTRIDVDYDPASNSFSVRLPDATEPYVLTYDAYILTPNKDLRNQVTLAGTGLHQTLRDLQARTTVRYSVPDGTTPVISLPPNNTTIRVEKVDFNGDPITGAAAANMRFGLFNAQNENELICIQNLLDTGRGVATFSVPLSELSDEIFVKELRAPDGYHLYNGWIALQKGSLRAGGTYTLRVVNYPDTAELPGKIIIQKVNSDDEPLAGAKFGVYYDRACTQEAAQSDLTGTDGTVTVSGLQPGSTYYVKEISAPAGYAASTAVLMAVANSNPTADNGALVIFSNDPIPGGFTIRKQGYNNRWLAGARFEVYDNRECTGNPIVSDVVTDANGRAIVNMLDSYRTYYIKEVSAPKGYILTDLVSSVLTNPNPSAEVAVIRLQNTPVQGGFTLEKESISGRPLEGAVFGVYQDERATHLIKRIETDENGKVVVNDLAANTTFYLKEIEAPEGYDRSPTITAVTAKEDPTTVTVVLENEPSSGGSGSGSGSGSGGHGSGSGGSGSGSGKDDDKDSPGTGDPNNPWLWAVTAALSSGLLAGGISLIRRRFGKEPNDLRF